jgi:hypothetical protein
MSVVWAAVIVAVVTTGAVGALLLVRRSAPEGGHFQNGDRAAGVFGVLATGFALLLGLIVFLAFTSYDESRAGAEAEALIVAQQFETAQFMPEAYRAELGGQLVCYARSVVHQEWPRMEDGTLGNAINPWGARLFRALESVDPGNATEEAAFSKWLDQTSDREAARNDRVHGAAGVIPGPLWVVLYFTAAVIFLFMLFFADRGEGKLVQGVLIGSVAAVITTTLILISYLDAPFREGFGGLRPAAMERTLDTLNQAQAVLGQTDVPPCDDLGVPTT